MKFYEKIYIVSEEAEFKVSKKNVFITEFSIVNAILWLGCWFAKSVNFWPAAERSDAYVASVIAVVRVSKET